MKKTRDDIELELDAVYERIILSVDEYIEQLESIHEEFKGEPENHDLMKEVSETIEALQELSELLTDEGEEGGGNGTGTVSD